MKAASVISALLVSILFSSCAWSKAIYLGEDIYADRAGPQSAETLGETGDINGVFPEAVYIKTRSQTFNAYQYYLLRDGLIWHKSIDGKEGPEEWTLMTKTGLPHNAWQPGFNKPERIVEISADADELVALSDEGGFYRYCFDKTIAHKSRVWLDRQGWPNEEQLYLDSRAAKNLSWALGKRNPHVLYYEDPFGNQHHNGTMEIATTYVLLEDGQEICYADTGLPGDFSRNYVGPERGAFKALALSASGSTMFVINDSGEMYTRIADFDIVGSDPMLFSYTYVPYQSDRSGTSYLSNLNEWGLPAEDWRLQPRIRLEGKAAITRHITILQNGRGNGARELRVAGLDEAGETGYWTKAIFDEAWSFAPVPLYFTGDAILQSAGLAEEEPRGERGPSLDKEYSGYYWSGGEREEGWEYGIANFNILEGDCDFLIKRRDETCALKLYPVEMWTYIKRNYMPGRTGLPKIFFVTLEIPDSAFDGLSPAFVAELKEKYAEHDRELFQYTIVASNNFIFMHDIDRGNADTLLFLTDGSESMPYTEFRQIRLVEDFEETRRYYSPELSVSNGATYEELLRKSELNRAFRDELKYQIRDLKWSRLTASRFSAGYLPAHYLVRITPLRFVNVPKLRTITRFGERLILTNSSHIKSTSTLRIWVCERIVELLEIRLQCYDELAREYSRTDSGAYGAAAIALPPWYSESASDYWGLAGLPRVVTGTFFVPGPGQRRTRIPGSLSFVRPGKTPELFGWYFALGDSAVSMEADSKASVFIDPLKSLKTIYSRGGKNPGEEKLQIDCAVYVDLGTDLPIARDIVDRSLEPFLGEVSRRVEARISFDGSVFEIREHPARHPNPLIFRGEL
jgi:hypothetical protein